MEDPSAPIYCARTNSATRNDHIIAELLNNLDGFVDLFEDKQRNVKFLKFGKKHTFLLWVKKLNSARQYSVVRAVETRAAHLEMLANGQQELLPSATIIVVGYTLSRDRSRVVNVSIVPTCARGKKPEWWIDLKMIPVIGKVQDDAIGSFKVQVTRSSQQQKIA